MLSGERVKRQDFVKLDEGRGDLSVETSVVKIWVWGPVGWRFGSGDQWGGDLGVWSRRVKIWVWGSVGWRFGCGDQWGGDLGVTSVTSEWWMFVLRE